MPVLRKWRSGGSWFKGSLGKKLWKPPSQPMSWDCGMCLSSQVLGKCKSMEIQTTLSLKGRPYLEKQGWEHGSSSRMPV
jgi:hypothetical protein